MKPKVIVFDLDFTLWDAGGLWCDCTTPPYTTYQKQCVLDAEGRTIQTYPDVPETLKWCKAEGFRTALASRTGRPDWANQLTEMLNIDPFIDFRQIYPGSKIPHLTSIRDHFGVEFPELLFFDDEERNIVDAKSINVPAVLVRRGVTESLVRDAIRGS